MKASYQEGEKPGYGSLVFSQALIPEDPWSVSIQRGSDKKFLTGRPANPWVSETFFMQLNGHALEDGGLALDVGPQIVDRLDQQEPYRIQLKGSDGNPVSGRLNITSINYSPSGSLGNTADVQIQEEEVSAPPPEPEPAPEPEPVQETEPEPEEQPGPEPAPERLEMEAPKASPVMRYLRWGLLVLLVIACLAWYFLDPRGKETGQVAEAPKTEEPAASEKAPAAEDARSAEEQVAGFFRSGTMTPKQAMELAAKLPRETVGQQDAIYRLYYFAADNNEPGSLLEYGACLDPSRPAWGSIDKNAVEAWDAYRKADNQEKAAQAMTHLRGWLEDQSRAGDKKAAQWLREIENRG